MILSSALKLRKTVDEQRNFIISKDFSIEIGAYTEESFELNPTEEKSYAPNKGIFIFCDTVFTLTVYSNDLEVERFHASFSNMPIAIRNTGEETLKFTIITF